MAIGELTGLDRFSGELHRLTRLFERANARRATRLSDGVERATYLLLVRLAWDGPQRLSELAEKVHSDTSTVSRQIATLVRLGLVERRPDARDGRAFLLAATEAGERSFEQRRQARNAEFTALLAGWTDTDRDLLCTLLGRFNDDFERYYQGDCP